MCDYCGHEFGASYPDSVCIDGFLWDADSGDEDGLTNGGEWACPRCNTRRMLEDAREEAISGGAGVFQTRPYCAAVLWEGAVRKAMRENPADARVSLMEMEPFETDDWPDRKAVYERRARWDLTVTVSVDPRSALMEKEGGK
ncbi:hypothetical protein [Xanthobacter sediminis]